MPVLAMLDPGEERHFLCHLLHDGLCYQSIQHLGFITLSRVKPFQNY
jgi:hypothetical protein